MSRKQLLLALPLLSLMLSGFSPNFAQEAGGGGAGWWIGVVIALALLVLLVWWLRRSSGPQAEEHDHHSAEVAHAPSRSSAHTPPAEVAVASEADVTPQDFVEAVVDEAEEVVGSPLGDKAHSATAGQDKAAESGQDFAAAAPASSPTRQAQASLKPDDLTVIEGIGPKIGRLLQDKGITTFAELAAADISRIEEILREAGLSNIAKPATWAEQAQLAADGKWEDLETLQNALKGGQRG